MKSWTWCGLVYHISGWKDWLSVLTIHLIQIKSTHHTTCMSSIPLWQGYGKKISWWFQLTDDTSHHYFDGCLQSQILIPRREDIFFQCTNCSNLVEVHITYICSSGVSWISLVWICLVFTVWLDIHIVLELVNPI
jgi:hypothetical protein